ncbi:hypothetical protein BTA51_24505 [Hahella sp. CCB-MM4]|uniref:ferredoxin reductase n=1 Tax=Hahella sp. (strain CCB-MM4) TaxID=1926491 RepID=UPI000B9B24D1|nr:ferredoxin reductase [Hahella sp. CCB-MM4]OZG70748.1 hypothetical protein BTA51_24505 [Hahella sp. CCB-MM4]
MKIYPSASYQEPAGISMLPVRLLRLVTAVFKNLDEQFWRRRGLIQDWLELALCGIDPLLSRQRMAAEVLQVLNETPETKTLVLRPPSRWKGFTEGQYLPVEVDINGVRMRRCYSISSTSQQFRRESLISITVKQVAGGVVSNFLNHQVRAGDILYIGDAEGKFTLDSSLPGRKPVFIAAGSGITPMMPMLEALYAEHPEFAATLIYYARNRQELIFSERLKRLEQRYTQLSVHTHFTEEEGRVNKTHLLRDCPDIGSSEVYLCGPEQFMATVKSELCALSDVAPQIHQESFGSAHSMSAECQDIEASVSFGLSGKVVQSGGDKSLLELAELAGLQPKFGCRGGVCHECTCVKTHGRVMNRLTGEVLPDEQEYIQACIAIPVGEVSIGNW